jgi:hypothetical protein
MYGEGDKGQKILADQEGVKLGYVRVYPGSSALLHQAVLAFTSQQKPFVMAMPGMKPVNAPRTSSDRRSLKFRLPAITLTM